MARKNAKLEDVTVEDALKRADQLYLDLQKIIQVFQSDWDTIVLANEVRRLRNELDYTKSNLNDLRFDIFNGNIIHDS